MVKPFPNALLLVLLLVAVPAEAKPALWEEIRDNFWVQTVQI